MFSSGTNMESKTRTDVPKGHRLVMTIESSKRIPSRSREPRSTTSNSLVGITSSSFVKSVSIGYSRQRRKEAEFDRSPSSAAVFGRCDCRIGFSPVASAHSNRYFAAVAELALALDADAVDAVARGLAGLRDRGGRLFVLGAGGGAGNASHAVNDFRKLCEIESY